MDMHRTFLFMTSLCATMPIALSEWPSHDTNLTLRSLGPFETRVIHSTKEKGQKKKKRASRLT